MKNLIITYKNWESLPSQFKANIEKIAVLNGAWHLHFFGNQEIEIFIKKNYTTDIFEAFKSIHQSYGAAQADFFRYLVLYRMGGIYIDAKTKVEQPFDTWISRDDQYIVSQWSRAHLEKYPNSGRHRAIDHISGGEFINWFLFSKPNHPFLKCTISCVLHRIQNYSPFFAGLGKGATLKTTGPIAYTLAVHPILRKHSHRFINNLENYGVSYSIMEGSNHESIFQNHYSNSTEPLSKIHPIHWLAYRAFRHTKRVARKILRVAPHL